MQEPVNESSEHVTDVNVMTNEFRHLICYEPEQVDRMNRYRFLQIYSIYTRELMLMQEAAQDMSLMLAFTRRKSLE